MKCGSVQTVGFNSEQTDKLVRVKLRSKWIANILKQLQL